MHSYLNQNLKELILFVALISSSVIFLIIYFLGGWKWLESISYQLQNSKIKHNWFIRFLLIKWEILVLAILVSLVGIELTVRFGFGYRKFRIAFFTISSLAISAVVLYFAKLLIGRVRPTTSERFPDITDSFPSGHTMMTTVIFLSLAILAFKNDFMILMAILCIPPIVMGYSRIRAGEHFIDDVVGGWLLGFTCTVGIHLFYFYYFPFL
ncbi:MAG: phosphatase PAP2 family protein [Firmicutes bacterium]|nr:phosphatase PAP2 family protein [Bacillota bacterium]MCL1954146.1 phosphatase PAP2 family protein [Bacillota bacterium]